MALIDDVKAAKHAWGKLSSFGRLFLVLSTFLSLNSIAGIKHSVIQWKGFLKDGFEFYRTILIEPLIAAFSSFDINVSESRANGLTLLAVICSSILRSWAYDRDLKYEWKDLTKITLISLTLFIFFAYPIIFVNKLYVAGIYSLIAILCYKLFLKEVFEGSFYKKLHFYTPYVAAIILLFVCAAINAGLNE
ncbi:hypothetical protein J1N51_03420 [Psychrosphaera ytuae]|uniref:Uncharacterized protein n=1 Tax=Psychrosphaera ytuae TaxID=2820710 RepID=A0A975DCF4_9GAMM|nr:hypothetical protein [Psychrosphaera ytuae]QTH64536.1 hypothetical protein J1N51_03420 [Psychrosphaera ytuae]